MNIPRAVRWENGLVKILDQRLLPATEKELDCRTVAEVFDAIRTLAVRGAPAIGIAAAYGLLLELPSGPGSSLLPTVTAHADYLKSARPTAVNLAWALDRMLALAARGASYEALLAEAHQIVAEDRQACAAIGRHGLALIEKGAGILTHCNAGSLAVSERGTALAPIYAAEEAGLAPHVYVDETRPLLQGARLTAFELGRAGVDCTLITDSMAASVMASGDIDLVLVGADRVAANGDVANKIGTLGVAVLCRYFEIPFYVACPESTLDPATPSGLAIDIEHRDAREVTHIAGTQVAPPGVAAHNPAFDVTPASLVTAIITESGIYRPTYDFS